MRVTESANIRMGIGMGMNAKASENECVSACAIKVKGCANANTTAHFLHTKILNVYPNKHFFLKERDYAAPAIEINSMKLLILPILKQRRFPFLYTAVL